MAITAAQVNELRQKTGLGMMECKKALEESGGDMQKSIDLLRTKGLAKMDSRTERASAEGRVKLAISPDRAKAAIVEINTETDFVAKNEAFLAMVQKVAGLALTGSVGAVAKTDAMQKEIDEQRLVTKENVQFGRGAVVGGAGSVVGGYIHFTGKVGVLVEVTAADPKVVTDELLTDLCLHVAAGTPVVPLAVDETGVPAEVIAKEKEIAKAQAIEQGKPEAIAEKMVTGKLRRFFEENCLALQPFVKDDKKKVKEILPKGVAIKSFVRYQVGNK